MSNLILEIDQPLTSSTQGEPMTATKSSSSTTLLTSSSTDQNNVNSTVPKAFSCSACSLQAYHLWVILRHIRNVHKNDGSNAKIIDNINNQVKFIFLTNFCFSIDCLNRLLKILMISNPMDQRIISPQQKRPQILMKILNTMKQKISKMM